MKFCLGVKMGKVKQLGLTAAKKREINAFAEEFGLAGARTIGTAGTALK